MSPCSSTGGHRDPAYLPVLRWSGGRPNLALISMTGCQAYMRIACAADIQSVSLAVSPSVVWDGMS